MINFLNLQVLQLEHDNIYHQDILSLTTQNRIKHLTLHFMKYAGKIQEISSESHRVKIYTDMLICCLSLANVLNISLDELIAPEAENDNKFIPNLIISCGKMAKACEALDHLESYPYRETLTQELSMITKITLDAISKVNVDVDYLIKQRWIEIESKSILLTRNPSSEKITHAMYKKKF